MTERPHEFGGDWTSKKLSVLKEYLEKYSTALKNKPSPERPFERIYIDAFAGTGSIAIKVPTGEREELLFPEFSEQSSKQFLDGSARIALGINPIFDKYIFVEKMPSRCRQLEEIRTKAGLSEQKVEIRRGDANDEIQKLCRQPASYWKGRRAVLFLDPYGMQIDWDTIEAIASTKAIDLWSLFPAGIGVNRMLTKTSKMPDYWRERLDRTFGTKEWEKEFYKIRESNQQELFGGQDSIVEKANIEAIGRYWWNRLKEVFSGVCEQPVILSNSKGSPMYSLVFAASNKKGAPIAVRIANHLLRHLY